MKIDIRIDSTLHETITIQAKKLTEDLEQVIRFVEQTYSPSKLYGRYGEEVHPINWDDITQVIVENKQVKAVHASGKKLLLDQRLYQLEEIMDHRFIRISKSEIININEISHMKLESNGMIRIFMKKGIDTYSSRRYLKSIKERLSL